MDQAAEAACQEGEAASSVVDVLSAPQASQRGSVGAASLQPSSVPPPEDLQRWRADPRQTCPPRSAALPPSANQIPALVVPCGHQPDDESLPQGEPAPLPRPGPR